MNKVFFLFPYTLICSVLLVGCNPARILGPNDKPEFESFTLEEMKIIYWVKVSDQEKDQRQLILDDPNDLKQGFEKLSIKDIEGYSLAVNEQILLRTNSRIEWAVSVVFDDRFDFGLKSEPYFAYNVYTENDHFYNWLLSVCRAHAEQDYPEIDKESIILRSNLSLKAYKSYGGNLSKPAE